MSLFSKKTWKNRQTEYPNRRTLTKEDGSTELVTVARAEGAISEEGDAFSEANMNDLEARILSAIGDGDIPAALGTDIVGAITSLNSNLSVRYNPDTDKVQIYYDGEWVDWKNGNIQGIDLYLTSRSLGEPSNTGMSNTTSRTFNFNTYVLGLSQNNYYGSSNCTGTIDSTGQISLVSLGAGYGLGIPMLLTAGKTYCMSGDITGSGDEAYAMFYTAAGVYGSSARVIFSGDTFDLTFTVPSGYPVVILLFRSIVNSTLTVSNLALKEV